MLMSIKTNLLLHKLPEIATLIKTLSIQSKQAGINFVQNRNYVQELISIVWVHFDSF